MQAHTLCTIMEHSPFQALPQLQLLNSIYGIAGINPPETASLMETSPDMSSAFVPVLPSKFLTPFNNPLSNPHAVILPPAPPQMAPADDQYAPGAMVGSSSGQDARDSVRAGSPFPRETAPGRDVAVHFVPTPSEPPVFQLPPVAPASQPSDSPPGHHLSQASSSVRQLRSPRDIQAGDDASVQSGDDAGDDRRNGAFSIRFDGYVGDGSDNMRTPSPVA